jgi:hypothetical protein
MGRRNGGSVSLVCILARLLPVDAIQGLNDPLPVFLIPRRRYNPPSDYFTHRDPSGNRRLAGR